MVRDSVRDRAAADAQAAVKYNSMNLPYDTELGDDGILAVCVKTGEETTVDVGNEYEDAPTTCPLCGADGTGDDIDSCTDSRASCGESQGTADTDDRQDGQDSGRTQAALSGFGGDN